MLSRLQKVTTSTNRSTYSLRAQTQVTDIAGLVKGAAEGAGLGNAFLSNIQAVDAIYHVSRAFIDKDIEHVEGEVDPVRDFEIINNELVKKVPSPLTPPTTHT